MTYAEYKYYSEKNYYDSDDLKFIWPYIKNDLNDDLKASVGKDLARRLDRADIYEVNEKLKYVKALGLIKLILSKYL